MCAKSSCFSPITSEREPSTKKVDVLVNLLGLLHLKTLRNVRNKKIRNVADA
jgi:hypothetical protein